MPSSEGYTTGGPSGGVTHQIGPSPSSMEMLRQLASRPSSNWGQAIGQLGAAFALSHAKKKSEEARVAKETATRERRQGWATQLGEGLSLRDLAAQDPGLLADTKFQQFWQGTREDPAAETWEVVQNPYGRGGVGQRGSISGQITGYQGAADKPREPDRLRATDQHGRLRYLDTGEPAFSDELLGPPPEADEPPLKDRLSMVRDLSSDWMRTTGPMQGLLDQSERMNIGFKMAQDGDMLAGSQAILISFNKLLDPTSVVRESEYARSATGQSALETLRGFVDKLSQGGAGVTLAELETYRRFGQMVVEKALESTVGPERERIGRLIEYAGVDPSLIFTGRFAPQGSQDGGVSAQSSLAAPPVQLAPDTAQASPPPGQAMMTGQGAADPGRIAMYANLPKDALDRQVAIMKANEGDYSPQELAAAALAWQAMNPGQ